MSTRYSLIALGLGLALSAFSMPAVAQTDSGVVAEIGGRKVMAEELEYKQAGKLLQAKYKYYLAERDVLDQYIADQLLEMQAKKEAAPLGEFFKRRVAITCQTPR